MRVHAHIQVSFVVLWSMWSPVCHRAGQHDPSELYYLPQHLPGVVQAPIIWRHCCSSASTRSLCV